MRKVEFFDTSLRDGEQTPGVNFSIKEKVAIAKQLEKWGISVIEAGFPAASPDSFEAVKQIAEAMTTTSVTGLDLPGDRTVQRRQPPGCQRWLVGFP
mgnify:CR=1 FL=1